MTTFHLFATQRSMLALLLAVSIAIAPSSAEPTVATETISTVVPGPELLPQEKASLTEDEPPTKEPWILPAQFHPWASFPVGAWREIEITTETFDETGMVFGRSVTTQKEILKAVSEDSYVLDVQATVDVSGKRIEGPWNTRVLRITTDRPGAVFSTTRQADKPLVLNVVTVNCQVWEVHYVDENRNLIDRIYYSPDVYPHVLQREVIEGTDDSPLQPAPIDLLTTVARDVPYMLEGRIVDCASQQIVRRRDKGDSQTLLLQSPVVPGGEVSNKNSDFDSEGRRIRWSVLKLVSFGESPSPDFPQEVKEASIPAGGDQK